MSRFITVCLQKGGVGKTATVVNVAAALARGFDLRVLVLDFDEQRNATKRLLGREWENEHPGHPSIESVLRGNVAPADAIVPTTFDPAVHLHVVPGTRGLSAWADQIAQKDQALLAFRDIIRNPVFDDYDVVFIDTPPAGGLWLQAALAASDGYVIVTQCELDALEGIVDLKQTATDIAATFNPELVLDGVVVNSVDYRRKSVDEFLMVYRREFNGTMLEPPIRHMTVVSEAMGVAAPVEFHDRNSPSAKEYRQIANQLNARLGLAGVNLTTYEPAAKLRGALASKARGARAIQPIEGQ